MLFNLSEAVQEGKSSKKTKRTVDDSPVKRNSPDFTADHGKRNDAEASDDSNPQDPLVSDRFEPRDNKEERDD